MEPARDIKQRIEGPASRIYIEASLMENGLVYDNCL